MFGKIWRRGPALAGVYENGHAILAQNYGRADRVPHGEAMDVPVGERNGGPVICYDGQMGNWRELAAEHGVADGPLRQERLLRSKEELHYFRILAEHFGTGAAVDTVGQWVCV
jgi:hypothetical protein